MWCLVERVLLFLDDGLLGLIEVLLQVEVSLVDLSAVGAVLRSLLFGFRLRARHRLILTPLLFGRV